MSQTIFEKIKHINEYGNEYWKARELYKVLEYSEYGKFLPTIKKAEISCEASGNKVQEHFAHVSEPQKSNNQYGEILGQLVNDVNLSRFACYLIIQNADLRKK